MAARTPFNTGTHIMNLKKLSVALNGDTTQRQFDEEARRFIRTTMTTGKMDIKHKAFDRLTMKFKTKGSQVNANDADNNQNKSTD